MKTKDLQDIKSKSEKVLTEEAEKIRKEITKLRISQHSSPTKDTNSIVKLKKKLAVVLTVISEKKAVNNKD